MSRISDRQRVEPLGHEELVGDSDGDRTNDYVILRTIARTRWHVLHHLHNVEALYDLTKQRICRWQLHAAWSTDNEELRTVGVWSGIRHCKRTNLILAWLWQLVNKSVARTTAAVAVWVSTLANESVNDAVEDNAVVLMLCCQEHEVVYRDWRSNWVERNNQCAHAGFHGGCVTLRRVNAHLWRCVKFLLLRC